MPSSNDQGDSNSGIRVLSLNKNSFEYYDAGCHHWTQGCL